MTELALLECVVSNPEEDLPRLVLADWWEENGQPERGEFVRVQVELAAAMPPVGIKDRPADLLGGQGRVFHKRGRESAWGKRQAFLRNRERELLGRLDVGVYGRNAWEWFARHLTWASSWATTRGFVSSLTCTATDFLRVERALLWPPETMACRTCKGKGQIFPRAAGLRGQWFPCLVCGGSEIQCLNGSGRIALPRPTDPCVVCEGERIFQTAAHPKNSTWTWEEIPCGNCKDAAGKPTGVEPRPFAATCQPITAVRITGLPPDDAIQPLARKHKFCWPPAGVMDGSPEREMLREIFSAEWSWVSFTLSGGAA